MAKAYPLLLIDSGNSAIKWQLIAAPSAGTPMSSELLRTVLRSPVHRMDNAMATGDRLSDAWQKAWVDAGGSIDTPWSLSWVSVGPAAAVEAVRQAFQRISSVSAPEPWTPVKSVGLALSAPAFFDNGYADARQLGADRWISALGLAVQGMMGAGEHHMIVSAGTATTIDVVACDPGDASRARFAGGWIFPGVRMMHQALRSGARGLDVTTDVGIGMDRAIPADSRSAMEQGVVLAQVSSIGLLARRYRVTKLWLHGGNSFAWRTWLSAISEEEGLALTVHEQPQLAFAGLLAMARCRRSAG